MWCWVKILSSNKRKYYPISVLAHEHRSRSNWLFIKGYAWIGWVQDEFKDTYMTSVSIILHKCVNKLLMSVPRCFNYVNALEWLFLLEDNWLLCQGERWMFLKVVMCMDWCSWIIYWWSRMNDFKLNENEMNRVF
jgi:hypothetical protein